MAEWRDLGFHGLLLAPRCRPPDLACYPLILGLQTVFVLLSPMDFRRRRSSPGISSTCLVTLELWWGDRTEPVSWQVDLRIEGAGYGPSREAIPTA
jgi:hypothetical protein